MFTASDLNFSIFRDRHERMDQYFRSHLHDWDENNEQSDNRDRLSL